MKKYFWMTAIALCGSLHADSITGWETVGDARSTDGAVYEMKRTVQDYPYVMLLTARASENQITGTIKTVYKGELRQSTEINCDAPQNLFQVQEEGREYLPEMFVLCKSVTIDRDGKYLLHDAIIIPRTRAPFLPEVALKIALASGQDPRSSAAEKDTRAASAPLPLIVTPPQSSRDNQGFSRPPTPGLYKEEKGILVIEYLSQTKYRSPNGNNTRFVILEYLIDPEGKELKTTSWEILEGSGKLANEHTLTYERLAPYTFRENMGDGESCIYKLRFDSEGKFKQLERTHLGKNGETLSQELIFSR